jgi:hypothetical protein
MKFLIRGKYIGDEIVHFVPSFRNFDIISNPPNFCSRKSAQKWMNKHIQMKRVTAESYIKEFGLIYFIKEL